MDREELVRRRMHAQHLLAPAAPGEVVSNLVGLQAQYGGNALHALAIRSNGAFTPQAFVKTWTLRGTLHLHTVNDLPLVLHTGCRTAFGQYFYAEGIVEPARRERFRRLVLDALDARDHTRAELRALCDEAGMTLAEAEILFHPWGGLLRALAERGELAYAPNKDRMVLRLTPFEPREQAEALCEMVRRYVRHYGPVTLRDAQTFFGLPQRALAGLLQQEAEEAFSLSGATYYCAGNTPPADAGLPQALFLAGFDPLLMGYRKTENPILPAGLIKRVYNNTGIVFPTVLLNGSVAAIWKRAGAKLTLRALGKIGAREQKRVERAAMDRFGPVTIQWLETDAKHPTGGEAS